MAERQQRSAFHLEAERIRARMNAAPPAEREAVQAELLEHLASPEGRAPAFPVVRHKVRKHG